MTKLAALLLVAAVATVSGEGFQKQTTSVDEILTGSESVTPVTNKSAASRHLLLLADTGNICYTGSSCQSSSYQCASGYSCYRVTDGSCDPSSCSTCSAGTTYYGCYTSQPSQTATVTYELDSSSGLRCYSSSSDCNSVASNTCTSSGTSCTFGASSYCSQTSYTYNYYCPNSVQQSTPSASSSPGSSSCNTAACNGCATCSAAQSCVSNYFCTGSTTVANFQCSTNNGVGSWSASCTVGSTSAASTVALPAAALAVGAAACLAF